MRASSLPVDPSFREDRLAGVAGWTDEQLDDTLAPLHEATRRAHLREMTNRRPVVEALWPYPIEVIRDAVEALVSEVNRMDTQLRSPFGVLVARARGGLSQRRPVGTQRATAPQVEQDDEARSWVRAAVHGLSEVDVTALDAFIAREIGGLVRMPEAMKQAMRLEYYEPWRASSAPL
ncbi:MAG: hypothetical protein Q7V57_08895 [Actinomycetota bacterium]|nr:hypothetical protein [Actinomycetota bacterium]